MRLSLSGSALCAALALAGAASFSRPLPGSASPAGLLVVAHGAGLEWNDAVRATVNQVRWPHGPVAMAFLMGEEFVTQGWDSAVTRLVREGSRSIVVVPLMVSSHGAHYRQVLHYAGLLEDLPGELQAHSHQVRAPRVRMAVTAALDSAPELGEALAARWALLGAADRDRAALLVAHGPTSDLDAERWIGALSSVGARLAATGLRREFRVGLLRDDAPPPVRAAAVAAMRDTIHSLARRSGDSVVVLPVLIATSRISQVRIPSDLDSLPIRYASTPLAPHPALARWIERSAEASLRSLDAAVVGRE